MTSKLEELARNWAAQWAWDGTMYWKLHGSEEELLGMQFAIKAFMAGYKQGRADALKEMMEGPPDGWCFHHDKLGWFWKEPDDPYHKEEMQRLGYTIVPVKLLKMEVSGGE